MHTEQSVESYALLNARAAYTLPLRKFPAHNSQNSQNNQNNHNTPTLTLFVKGENLTATSYQISYGFPMPRATVLAGLTLHF